MSTPAHPTVILKTFFDTVTQKPSDDQINLLATQCQCTTERVKTWFHYLRLEHNVLRFYAKLDELGNNPVPPSTHGIPVDSQAHVILKTYFMRNVRNPYPSPRLTEELARRSQVTVQQVNSWFHVKRNAYFNKLLNDKQYHDTIVDGIAQVNMSKYDQLEVAVEPLS